MGDLGESAQPASDGNDSLPSLHDDHVSGFPHPSRQGNSEMGVAFVGSFAREDSDGQAAGLACAATAASMTPPLPPHTTPTPA